MTIIEIFNNIANSIRNKLGISSKITPNNYGSEIGKIVTNIISTKEGKGNLDIAFHDTWTTQEIEPLSVAGNKMCESTGDNAIFIDSDPNLTSNTVDSYNKSLTKAILDPIIISKSNEHKFSLDSFNNEAIFFIEDTSCYLLKYNNSLIKSTIPVTYLRIGCTHNDKYLFLFDSVNGVIDLYNTSGVKSSMTSSVSGESTTYNNYVSHSKSGWVGKYIIYFPTGVAEKWDHSEKYGTLAYYINENLSQSSFEHGLDHPNPGNGNAGFEFPHSIYKNSTNIPDFLMIQFYYTNGTTHNDTPVLFSTSLTKTTYNGIKDNYHYFMNFVNHKQYILYSGEFYYKLYSAVNYIRLVDNNITVLDPITIPFRTTGFCLTNVGEYTIGGGGYTLADNSSDTNSPDNGIMIIPALDGDVAYQTNKMVAINYLE